MANNIAVSITADVAGLTVGLAQASAAQKAYQKDLNDLVRAAKDSGGATDAMKASMLAAADGVAKAKSQVGLINGQLRSLAPAGKEAAAGLNAAHGGMSGIIRESIVMTREASRANFSRMAGSASILAQRLWTLNPAIVMTAAGIAALLAPVIAVAAAMEGHAQDIAKFQNAIELTGNFAGLTGGQYEDMAARIAAASNTGVGTARAALLELTKSGRFTGDELEQLGKDALKFSQLTGTASKTVLADFIKMADGPTRYAEEFNRSYHALTLAQLEHVKTLEDEGNKTAATAELVKDLTHWLDDQTVHMGGLAGAWHGLATGINDAWNAFKNFASSDSGSLDTRIAQLNARISEMRQHGTDQGMPHSDPAYLAMLEKTRDALQAKAAADNNAAQATANATRTQQEGTDAYEDSHKTMESLRSSASAAKDAVAALHREMAARLAANPQDKEALDYQANSAKYDQALLHKMDPGDNKKPKKPKDDDVQVWEQELQAKLEAEKNYFADSKSEELAFWQTKVAMTTAGSAQQRQVQTKVFDLTRDLAKQAYTDQLAVLNDRLEADRDNWSKEQADWNAKLAFIKAHYGQESSEYQNANREMEAAERTHQQAMKQIQRDAEQSSLDQLKESLATNKTIREEDARTQESVINTKGSWSPVGEIQAATQVAALHKQLNAQDLADAATTYAAEDALRQQAVARALVSYGTDSTQYAAAVKAKQEADQQYYDKRRVMEDQALQQSIRDAQEIQQKWQGITQPIGSSFAQMFQGMYMRQETFSQAALKMGDQLLFKFVDVAMQDLAKWTATQLAKTGIIKAQSVAQGAASTASTTQAAIAQKAADQIAVAGYAGEAAAATFAAYSPEAAIDPGLPASMAAAAFAQAMSFGSFAKGVDVVPRDMINLTHAGERIMPAADNAAIIAAVRNGTGQGAARGGAQVNNTFHNTFQHVRDDPEEMASQLMPILVARMTKLQRRGMLG